MKSERWQKINELFHAALELEANERAAYLKKECGADESLFEEVTKFVNAHQEAEDFIDRPVAEEAFGVLSSEIETSVPVGKKFGVYEIIEEIGRGGMGAVFLAERTDREFEKRVAIKIIKRGMDTDAVLRRFRNERQILASLEHPNIARLLDGGTTDDGLPYFVMEYIEGLPINEFAETNKLSINERLELFRQICSAIVFAHQRLIIHRDIKPSNIIVTKDGVPKLLDFGIAKLMNPERIGNETVPTATGLRLLTPDYASPEQIQGLQVTTLSDVYSLGVVLYELLSGQSPYRFKKYSLFEIANIINTEEPLKPSDAAHTIEANKAPTGKYGETTRSPKKTVNRNAHLLRGDLDNIVLMAIRKEPERRYSSVGHFSEDIRRHLAGLPVIARPLNLKYRLAKFVLRNKTAVALGAIIFLTLIGGIITTTWQSIRANRQKELTEKRFNEVRKLARTVLFDYHDAIKDLPGSTPVRERLVRDALEYLDGLASEATNDVSLQLELATAYERVGDVQGGYSYANLGNTEGAIASYQKSLSILQTPPISESQNAETLFARASCAKKLSALFWEKGDMKGALEEAQRSQKMYGDLLAGNPSNFDYRYQYSAMIDRAGKILQDQGDLQTAQQNFEKYLELLNGFSPDEKETEKIRLSFSIAYEHSGLLFMQNKDFVQALERNTKSLEIRQKLSREFPLNAGYLRAVGLSYYNQGEILAELLKYREALQSYQKDVEIAQSLLAKDPSNELYRGDTAYGLVRIGDMLVKLGDHNQAIANYRRSQAMRAEDVKTDPTNLFKRSSLIDSYIKIARTLSIMGQIEPAKNEAAATRAQMEKTDIEPDNANIRSFFAVNFMDLGETYGNLANLTTVSAIEREKLNKISCAMYQQSSEIFQDMTQRKIMSKGDEEAFDKLKTQLEKCK